MNLADKNIVITFKNSKSTNFLLVKEMAEKFEGYSLCANNEHTIKLSIAEIFEKWDQFYSFYHMANGWASFSLVVNGEKMPYGFSFHLPAIRDCYNQYLLAEYKPGYCNTGEWPCRKLDAVRKVMYWEGNNWYKNGHFENNYSIWKIHKTDILNKLKKDIQNKNLMFCPVFNLEKIIVAVDALPDIINLKNNDFYRIITDKRFVGERIEDVPVSITHTSGVFEDMSLGFGFGVIQSNTPKTKSDFENPFEPESDEWANWEIENHKNERLSNNSKDDL